MTEFAFRPELFDAREQAQQALSECGFNFFEHYLAIDLLHEEYGLEVCGIREYETAMSIQRVMQKTFPEWSKSSCYLKEYGSDSGWKIVIQHRRW